MNAKELIYNMLTENTGSHMLDSGGAYGRNWERNQVKTIEDFENEPEEVYTYAKRWNELSRIVSVYHYLSQLEIDSVCEAYNSMPCDNWDAEGVYGVSSEQWDWLNHHFAEVNVVHTFNTYNGLSDLSQILQGSWLKLDGDQYVLLQIHGGCDARGGYTSAKLFLTHEDWTFHSYLDEYKDSDYTQEDLEGGYIQAVDYDDPTIVYTSEQLLELMKQHETNSK